MNTIPPQANQGKRYYCYVLLYPEDYPESDKAGTVFYVGKGTRRNRPVNSRLNSHLWEARRGVESHKCNVIRRIWAAGLQVVEKKIAFFDTNEEVCMHEIALITLMDNLTNLTLGGEGALGIVVSEETRRKRSEAVRGRKQTVDHIRKRADAKRGKPLSTNARAKHVLAHPRRVCQGFIAPDGTRYEHIVGLSTFCLEHGLSVQAMRKVATGKATHHKGWTALSPKPKPPVHNTKMWLGFIAPDGTRHENIVNLTAFCREHGLNTPTMLGVAQGKLAQHKGWKPLEPKLIVNPKEPKLPANTKIWRGFISPDGTCHENIVGLKTFCREHGLNPAAMRLVDQGKATHHKGWRRLD